MSRLSREPTMVEIEGFTHGGEGVARIDGKAVFVPGAIPGETLEVRVVDDRKRWARAAIVDVVARSEDRVEPPCPYAPRFPENPDRDVCGGCDLQHIAPEAQRELKARVVHEQLQRLGGVADPPVAPTRPVGPDVGYRTRARLHADADGRLGFHAPGSNAVTHVDRCLVLDPATQRLRDEVGDATGAAHVTVRANEATAAVVLEPGPGGLDLPSGEHDLLLAEVAAEVDDDRSGGESTGLVAVRGDGRLRQRVAGHDYGFDVSTFFQVSPQAAGALVEQVSRAVGDVTGALVWDLYAGVGLFSLPLAAAGAEVVAVEGHAGGADWARVNAADAGLELRVETGSVERFVTAEPGPAAPATPRRGDPPDVVVLDPPRAGAGATVCEALADLLPARIVYVACDVAALARDTRTLTSDAYRLVEVVPLDAFPMTHHVEVVATFAR